MIAFVLCSVLAGLVAGVLALISGVSFVVAFLIYAGVGIFAITAVLVRALICQRIVHAKSGLMHST